MAGEDPVTWNELEIRCAGCRRLSEANHDRIVATVQAAVSDAIATKLKDMVPTSILWTNKLESGITGAIGAAFLSLIIFLIIR